MKSFAEMSHYEVLEVPREAVRREAEAFLGGRGSPLPSCRPAPAHDPAH